MIKINDKIVLGVVAGLLANIIRNITGFILYNLNIQAFHIWHFAASPYLDQEEIRTFSGTLLGFFTDYLVAGFIGVFSVYFLSHSGTQYLFIKGIVIGGAAWLFIFTLAASTPLSPLSPETSIGALTFFLNHLLLGVLILYFVNKFEIPEN